MHFKTTLTVEKPPMGMVMVQLDGSTSTGWTTTVDPQSIPFTKSGSLEISIAVVIPQATPVMSAATLMVNALATYPGGSAASSTTGTIQIRQYFKGSMNLTPELGLGNPQHYIIAVYNKGNGNDSFNIRLPDGGEVSKKGFLVALSKTETGIIIQDGHENLELVVEYGPTTLAGRHSIRILIESVGSLKDGGTPFRTESVVQIEVNPITGKSGQTVSIIAIAMISIVGVVVLLVVRRRRFMDFFKSMKEHPRKRVLKNEPGKS